MPEVRVVELGWGGVGVGGEEEGEGVIMRHCNVRCDYTGNEARFRRHVLRQ